MSENKKTARPNGTDSATITMVIKTESMCGSGVMGDPVRKLIQYWTLTGQLIATIDPLNQDSEH